MPLAVAMAIAEAEPVPAGSALDGRATLGLGTVSRPQMTADIDVTARAVGARGVVPVGGRLTARIANGRWQARVDQRIPGAARATGELAGRFDDEDATRSTVTGPLDVRVTDLGAFARAMAQVDVVVPDLVATSAGEISAALQMAGTLGAPVAAGAVASEGLDIPDVGPALMNLTLTASSDVIAVEDVRLTAADATIDAAARVALASGAIDGTFRAEAPDLSRALAMLPEAWRPAGALAASGTLAGTTDAPEADVEVATGMVVLGVQHVDEARATLRVRGETVHVDRLTVTQGDGRVEARGHYTWTTGAYATRIDATAITVEDALGEGVGTRARVDIVFEGAGTIDAPAGEGRALVDLEGGTAGALVGRTSAEISLDGARARVSARAPGIGAFVDGAVAVAAPHDYRAVIVVDRLDLVPPAIVAGAREDRIDGTLSLSALATGRALEPGTLDAAINLQALDVAVGGVPVRLAAPARLRWIEGGLTAGEVVVGVGEGELRASGRFSEEQAAEWRTTLEAEAAELVAMAQAFAAVPDALAARGRVALDWRSAMNARQADASIAVTGGVLQWEDLPPLEAVQVQATFDGTTIDVPRVTGTWQGGGLEASARLPRALFDEEAPVTAAARGFAKARLTGLAPAALAPWVDAATLARMTGRLSASLDAVVEAPSLAGVRGTLVLDEAAMTLDGVPVAQRAPSRFTLADGRLEAADVEWNAGGSPLRLAGHVDLTTEVPALDLRVAGRADLRVAGVFDPTIATDGGADVDVRITGTSEEPAFSGRITLDGAELVMRDPQVLLTEVRGRIDLEGDRITFQEVTGEVNGGRLVVVGGVTHRALALTGGTVIVQLQGAALEYPLGLQSEADALLQFTPGPGEPRLFGDVRILRSGYLAPISLPAIVAANRAGARPVRGEPSWVDTIRLNVAVETVTDMVVDNNYGRFEAGAQVRVVGTLASPGMVGRATLREGGQMYLAGNTFRIERGAISFIGQNTIEPDFDIEVRTQTAGQDVTVSLSGTLDRLETDVRSSNPDVATEELVSLLLGGTGAGFGGADALRLFSAELLGATGRAFGLDSLRLERGLADDELRADPGQISDQADPSARLTLAKRLRPDVEVILSQNLRESGLSAILNYRPRSNIELRGISRDNQDRGYSLRHEITFGGGGRTAPPPAAPEPRVSSVAITGSGVDEPAHLGRLRLGVGDRFNFHTWQRDIDRLRAAFHADGRFEARVRATRVPDDAAGTVALTYRVDPGPRTLIVVEGHDLPARVRRDLEQAWTRAIFDQFLAQDLDLRVRRHLVDRGWIESRVRVDIETSEDGASKVARLAVDPGVQVGRHEIRFEGRRALDAGVLDRAVADAGLEIDAWVVPARLGEPIVEAYAREGYLDARVSPGTPAREGDRAVLPVTIVEGQRYHVGAVSLEGVAPPREDGARADARLDSGAPFTDDVIERARQRVESAYRRQGFNSVRVDVRPALDEGRGAVDVTFVVDEGPQQVLADVAVAGASRTRAGVVERTLRLRVGEPVDLNEWALGRKRLYDTNVFRQVDLLVQPMGDPVDGVERVRANVTVQEWPAWRFRYGVQLNDERVSEEEEALRSASETSTRNRTVGVVGDLRSQNLFGRAVGAGLTTRVEPDRRAGNTFVSLPGLGGLPVTTNLYLFGDRQTYDIEDVFTFINDRVGASLEQRWRRTRATQVAWSYRFERSRTYDAAPDPADDFPLDLQFDVARFSLTTLVDRRDDPFNARRGWFSSMAFEYAAPEIGSDLRLAKLFAQQTVFVPVGPVVLAGGLQVGAAFADDLIPSERFRAGGGYTVRGYEESGLGPVDFLGRPRGGNAMLVVNQEVRFPVFRWVRGVAFLDAGNVFADRGDVSFSDLRLGYGAGLRIDTPFALVRVDYGLAGTRRPNEPRGRWYFGIGQVF